MNKQAFERLLTAAKEVFAKGTNPGGQWTRLKVAVDALEAAPAHTSSVPMGWISVDEEMPTPFEYVLVAIRTGIVLSATFSPRLGWDWSETDDMTDMDDDVTHWMSLPLEKGT